MVGAAQPPTWRCGTRTWTRRSSWSITSCSIAVASRPHGGAQCGTIRPASASRARRSSFGRGGDLVGDGRDLGADRLGLGRQVEGEVAALPGDARSSRRRRAHGPPPPRSWRSAMARRQVEVGVVLPGEADAAEHLDAVLGDLGEGVEGDGARREHRQVRGPRRPGRRARGRRPTPPPAPARGRRACRRSGASRPGTGRSAGRTACGPWRRRPRCRRTTPPRPPPRRRPAPGRARSHRGAVEARAAGRSAATTTPSKVTSSTRRVASSDSMAVTVDRVAVDHAPALAVTDAGRHDDQVGERRRSAPGGPRPSRTSAPSSPRPRRAPAGPKRDGAGGLAAGQPLEPLLRARRPHRWRRSPTPSGGTAPEPATGRAPRPRRPARRTRSPRRRPPREVEPEPAEPGQLVPERRRARRPRRRPPRARRRGRCARR